MRRVPVVVFVALALTSCGTTTVTTVTTSVPGPPPTPVTTSTSTSTSTPSLGAVYFEGAGAGRQQKPTSLELTGDGTLFVAGVQWTAWGGSVATGSGNAEYHGCTPTCAQATLHTALVSIRLSGIRVCSGRHYYSGVTLRLNSGRLLDEQFLQRSWSPC